MKSVITSNIDKVSDRYKRMSRNLPGVIDKATHDLVQEEALPLFGKTRGAANIMLTMTGEDGQESCKDCTLRKGKRYSARKWLAIGYPPSRDFECHGYNCQHYLVTDDGKRWTQ